jgi:chorismate mutase/prephenate dehydratase
VWGKPDAIAATREWIRRALPKSSLRKADTFAEALAHARKDPGAVLVADIQEKIPLELGLRSAAFHESQTRYWVLGKSKTLPTGHDKTSLMFTLADRVGALQMSIADISGTGINITRIESRPSQRDGHEFNFFLDIGGHIQEPKVQKALAKLRKQTLSVKVLGAYPIVDGRDKV